MLGRYFSLAACGFLLAISVGCKTKYVCPAYTSAFVLDMPAYKVSKAQDSMAIAADTSLDVDVIMLLAERIWPPQQVRSSNPDSLPFPDDKVVKTQYLLLKKVSRKKKNKLLASVPMITVFPASTDTTGEDTGGMPLEDQPRDMSGEDPSTDPVNESTPQESSPEPEPEKIEKPKKKEEEDTNPF